MNLNYVRAASHDIDTIFLYIAEDRSVEIADHVIDKITDACERLCDFPELGRRRKEFDVAGKELRSIAESSYTIFYFVDGGALWVARVMDGRGSIGHGTFAFLEEETNALNVDPST